MKLKSKDGQVEYLMQAGAEVVWSRMPEEKAQKMIENGETKQSKRYKGFPLCVDDKFYFPVIAAEPKKNAKR